METIDSISSTISRRNLLAAGTGTALVGSQGLDAADKRVTSGIIDCQSHLFFPEVLDLMRKRKSDPGVYDRDGTTFLKMGTGCGRSRRTATGYSRIREFSR